jgi:hypothetical protein
MAKPLLTQLRSSRDTLLQRIDFITKEVSEPDHPNARTGYSLDMIPPLRKQIEELDAAILGLELFLPVKAGKRPILDQVVEKVFVQGTSGVGRYYAFLSKHVAGTCLVYHRAMLGQEEPITEDSTIHPRYQ